MYFSTPDILIVEDDRTSGSLLKALLRRSSLSVSEIKAVGRLDDALKCLDQSSYDLVLLDLNLPDSCGVVTLASVAKAHSHLAIVVITGEHDENLAMAILAKGAQDYLVKGKYSSDTLIKTIRYALGRKVAENAMRVLGD